MRQAIFKYYALLHCIPTQYSVFRVPRARERKLTVDQTRSSLMDKINKNQILAAAERVAERDRERRQRISRGEPPDLDESTYLLNESDENVQFLPFMVSSLYF